MQKVTLKKGNKAVIESCLIATDFFSRFFGLMGKTSLSESEALCFPRCNSIHTFFMRMPIDVLFVNGSGRIVEILESLSPWKVLLPRRKVKHTIEMQAGRARSLGLQIGDQLQCEGVWNEI